MIIKSYQPQIFERYCTCRTLNDVICRYKGAPKSPAAVLATTKETTATAVAPDSLGSGGSAGGRSFSVLFPFLPGNKDRHIKRKCRGRRGQIKRCAQLSYIT